MLAKTDYDLVVIGAGAGGLTAAGLAASLGARTLLIEKDRTGGECTWSGCVPSKALIALSTRPSLAGNPIPLQHVRSIRDEIWREADSPERLADFGVEVLKGYARLSDRRTIEVETESTTKRISSRYFIIATGATFRLPKVQGLHHDQVLTPATFFDLPSIPQRLAILGTGPSGVELAQAASRLGSEVTLIGRGSVLGYDSKDRRILPVVDRLAETGVNLIHSTIEQATVGPDGLLLDVGQETIEADRLLAVIGKRPDTSVLGSLAADLRFNDRFIDVNRSCRTSVGNIAAVGDVTQFGGTTHRAEEMARIAVRSMILKIPSSIQRHTHPQVVFCSPQVASVGRSSKELVAAGIKHEEIVFPVERIDRAIVDRLKSGSISIRYRRLSGRILGATVIAEETEAIIGELTLAMRNGISLRKIADTIHAYPSWSQGARRAAEQYYVRHTPRSIVALAARIFRLRGTVSQRLGGDEPI